MNQIQLIGPFAAYDHEGKPLILRGQRALYAILVLAQGQSVSRRDLINAVWPGVPLDAAQNRLRVSLSKMRRILGDALVESANGFSLSPDRVESDYGTVLAELNDIENEVDEAQECDRLGRLLPQFRTHLLVDTDEPWVEPYRELWSSTALKATRRLSAIAPQQSQFRLAAEAAATALVHEPHDDEHWKNYLQAKVRIGESGEALHDFAAARKQLQAENTDFDESTLELATEIRLGRFSPDSKTDNEFTLREMDLIVNLFAAFLERNVNVFERWLSDPVYREEQNKSLDASISLLNRIVERVDEDSDMYVLAQLQLVMAECMLNHAPQALARWSNVKGRTMNPYLRGLTLNLVSFSLFQIRDYEAAIAAHHEASQAILQSGETLRARAIQNNLASYQWHLGNFELADELYANAIEASRQIPGFHAEVMVAVSQANMGYSRIMQGKYEEAIPILEEALLVVQKHKSEGSIAMAMTAFGCCRFLVKDDPSGLIETCKGIKMSYHLKHERALQIALDYGALALAHAGCAGEAVALIAYATEWRDRTGHFFSVAEGMLRERTLDQCEGAKGTADFPLSSPSTEILCNLIRILRRIASERTEGLARATMAS